VPVNVLLVRLIVLLVSVAVAVLSATSAAVTKAVVASWVVLVPATAVGAKGVPVKVGDTVSALVLTATEIALYSVSISVPLMIFAGSPDSRASLAAKSVFFT
jgi:hypothetical protein